MIDYDSLHDIWTLAHEAGSPTKFVRDTVIYEELAKLPPGRSLDAGCGIGQYSVFLEKHGHAVTAFDPSPAAVQRLVESVGSESSIEASVSSIEAFSASEPFDNIISVEVLEHVEDDIKAVQKLCSLLRSGGTALISIPASPLLYGEGDRVSGHFRRYTRCTLRKLLDSCDFQRVSVRSYGFPLLFVYAIARKLFLDRRLIDHFSQEAPGTATVPKTLRRLYPYVFTVDRLNIPFGNVGYVAVCRK